MYRTSSLGILLFIWVLSISCNQEKVADDIGIALTIGSNTVTIVCNENNDLYQLLKTREQACKRYDNIAEALKSSQGQWNPFGIGQRLSG